ncbi:hypothetical protein JFL43_13260 [Viridibacillus sp. YIM B01967]|uniref:WVELL protein n=1 Tax=Viridibacillus soli TaxID=2798301 RepID=A0ABS1H9M4_9BACL|nr:YfhJ family protein [Viridibacillus soli]MBK3495807.1 hypothetical protein [Viridibacillus soli]
METVIDTLVSELKASNELLTEERARVWIELLWSDFEATYAKAGYDYQGAEMTEKIIRQWIQGYGHQLHDFAGRNPKYAHLLDTTDN